MLEKFKVSKFLTFPKLFTILHTNCLCTSLLGILPGFCRCFVTKTDLRSDWLLKSQLNSYTHLF